MTDIFRGILIQVEALAETYIKIQRRISVTPVAKYNEKGAANEHDATLSDNFSLLMDISFETIFVQPQVFQQV